MGGKCLKNTYTERKTTEQFYDIQSRLLPKLKEIFETEIYVLKFYHTKPDHGDMDILLKVDHSFYNKKLNILKEIKKHLSPNEIVVNDGTTTFDFEQFQIDLIPVAESVWESTKFWMDYDPSSNLLGKICHKFGLKFSPSGTFYPYRGEGGRVMKDIVITKDFRKMMEFLGLDPERKYQGFETLEDIYEWIISSKYYNTEFFLLDNLTQSDRKRNKKRPTFNKFLEYVKDIPYTSEGYHFEKNKTKYLDLIDSSFPEVHFLEQIDELKKKDAENQKLREKFNGEFVMEWTGLKGKELGEVIVEFKKHHSDEWIKHYNADAVHEKFMEWFINIFTKVNLSSTDKYIKSLIPEIISKEHNECISYIIPPNTKTSFRISFGNSRFDPEEIVGKITILDTFGYDFEFKTFPSLQIVLDQYSYIKYENK